MSQQLQSSRTITRLSSALGAEVRGVDLTQPIDDETFVVLRSAFLEHCVLVFRDQVVSPADHSAFTERWGQPGITPFRQLEDYPAIADLDYAQLDKTVTATWHSDMMAWEEPPMASILYARAIPPLGGDTAFANEYLAYEALSPGLKRLLDGVKALNRLSDEDLGKMGADPDEFPTAVHPVVRTHPETGKKCLYVCNSYTRNFEDMTAEESRSLIEYLSMHAARPEFVYRHRWQLGDLLMWDNRCTQHYAVADYTERRSMYRSTVQGQRPI